MNESFPAPIHGNPLYLSGPFQRYLWAGDLTKVSPKYLFLFSRDSFFSKNWETSEFLGKTISLQSSVSPLIPHLSKKKLILITMITFPFSLRQLNMSSVVQDSNEKHLQPWSEACSNDQIVNTPLSPYLDKVCALNLRILVFQSLNLRQWFLIWLLFSVKALVRI